MMNWKSEENGIEARMIHNILPNGEMECLAVSTSGQTLFAWRNHGKNRDAGNVYFNDVAIATEPRGTEPEGATDPSPPAPTWRQLPAQF